MTDQTTMPQDWADCPKCGAMRFYLSGRCMQRCDAQIPATDTGITPDAPEGWKLMKEKTTGRVIGMRYIPDACDGGVWEIRGSNSLAHPDTIYHGWEAINDAEI